MINHVLFIFRRLQKLKEKKKKKEMEKKIDRLEDQFFKGKASIFSAILKWQKLVAMYIQYNGAQNFTQ